MKGGDYMPMRGDYQQDSNYFIGILPDGSVKWYAQEGDWKEEFAEMEKQLQAKT